MDVLVSRVDAGALAPRSVGWWRSGFLSFGLLQRAPFFGFRGIVARAGCEYRVTVAAEMDFYPQYLPWAFVTPSVAGAREDGKLSLDLAWRPDSSFADVIGAVVLYIEGAQRAS
jgi:hypothetical protein